MEKRKFWPLDFDPEGEIYENVAWDLPGYKSRRALDLAPSHRCSGKQPAECRGNHRSR